MVYGEEEEIFHSSVHLNSYAMVQARFVDIAKKKLKDKIITLTSKLQLLRPRQRKTSSPVLFF